MTHTNHPKDLAEERKSDLADEIIYRAARMIVEDVGAPTELLLDRLFTFSAAQACKICGSPQTAAMFREMADKIEAGAFHRVTREAANDARRH